MECIATPLIALPEWHDDQQDAVVFRLASQQQDKQPTPYLPLARNAAPTTANTKRRQVRHMRRHTVQNISLPSASSASSSAPKRVRFDRSAIVKPRSSTTTAKSGHHTKTKQQWEQLLLSSIEGLQGLYSKMDTPAPSVQTSPVLGDRFPKPDLLATTNMAFRALQIASGSPVSSRRADEYDGDMSSGSEESDACSSDVESPATPRSARMGSEESMDLDDGFITGMPVGYEG